MDLDNTLGFILGRVSRKVHYRLDEIFKANDITIEQWVGLRMIDEEGPLCQKELADRMEKNQNTIKALIDRLEAKGTGGKDGKPSGQAEPDPHRHHRGERSDTHPVSPRRKNQ